MPAKKSPKPVQPKSSGLILKETLVLNQYLVGTYPVPRGIADLPVGWRKDTITPENGSPQYLRMVRDDDSVTLQYQGFESSTVKDTEGNPEQYAKLTDRRRNSILKFCWDIKAGDQMQVLILINQRARDYSKMKNQNDAEFAALERIIRDPANTPEDERWQAAEGAAWLAQEFIQAVKDCAAKKPKARSLRAFGDRIDQRLKQVLEVEKRSRESVSADGWDSIHKSNWSKGEKEVCVGLADMLVDIFNPPAGPLPSRKALIEHLKRTTGGSHSYDTVKPALDLLGMAWIS